MAAKTKSSLKSSSKSTSKNSKSIKGKSTAPKGSYIDAFVIPVPTKSIESYRKLSNGAGKIWKEYGALEYRECMGDDVKSEMGVPFPALAKAKPSETVVFSWIVYKSKAHRDSVNKKVISDPRMSAMMANGEKCPFDVNRMTYGGFKIIVNL